MRRLTLRGLNRFLAFSILLLFIFVLYSLFGPINPADLKSLTVPTNQSLQAGTEITYITDSCRYVGINVETDVVRSLTAVSQPSLQSLPLSTDDIAIHPGCHTLRRQVVLPTATPAGCYRLTIRAIYTVASYRAPIAREVTSNEFCVTVPPQADQLLQLQTQVNSLEQSLKALESNAGIKGTTAVPSASNTAPAAGNATVTVTNALMASATSPTTVGAQQAPVGTSREQLQPALLKVSGLVNSLKVI